LAVFSQDDVRLNNSKFGGVLGGKQLSTGKFCINAGKQFIKIRGFADIWPKTPRPAHYVC
jgi:hypothetical protein